jgi:hypothetical protein
VAHPPSFVRKDGFSSAAWACHFAATNVALEHNTTCIGTSLDFFQDFLVHFWIYRLCFNFSVEIDYMCMTRISEYAHEASYHTLYQRKQRELGNEQE